MHSSPPFPLSALFAPKSVAIIGASDDPDRLSGRPVRYLIEAGYPGHLMPVNPNRAVVQGIRAYASVAELPECPDVALIVVPAAQVYGTVQACLARGIRGIYLLSGGFAETGNEGASQQHRLRELATAAGARILGPNCLGAFNAQARFFGTFATSLERGLPVPGPVAIVSQSGAYGQHLAYLAARRGLGVSYLITTGNELDVELSECIAWLVEQPEVQVILAYAEGVRNGPGLLRALESARQAGKPVVFLKVGSSEAGARAASSHTAALAGSDEVCDAALRQAGAYRARTTEEQLDIAYACARSAPLAGRRLGIVTLSGGAGVHASDLAELHGLDVPALPEAAGAALRAAIPFGGIDNPIDVTGQAVNDMGMLSATLRCVTAADAYDVLFVFLTTVPLARKLNGPLRETLSDSTSGFRARHPVVLGMVADEATVREYEQAGFLVYEDLARAIRAVSALAWFGRQHARPPILPAERPRNPGTGLPRQAGPLSEVQAKHLLAAAGLRMPAEELVATAAQARKAAQALGFPVAMKIVSAQVPHKTEVGGVLLNVADARAAVEGFDTLLARVRKARPDAHIEGVLISPMAPEGVETIVGTTLDPVFGPVVMFGLGGITAECFKDVALRVAPVDEATARGMVAETRAAALLQGWRGAAPCDVDALVHTIVAISELAAHAGTRIQSLEINPLRVLPGSQGVAALDAMIVAGTPGAPGHQTNNVVLEHS
ncbi:CoA-binding protein [Bordetella petrii]|nr:CoA-binding protein [Bordetella petrii]